jgi:hypothetical protein
MNSNLFKGGTIMKLQRRELLSAGIGTIAGLFFSRVGTRPSYAATNSTEPLNWKQPQKINIEQAAKIAYEGYKERSLGCCHGTFKGLVKPIFTQMGAPYDSFPIEIMRAGKSGVADSGSLCGSLLGAAYAFHLFFDAKVADEMQKELHRWYSQAMLPIYVPSVSNFKDYMVPQTKAVLPECHASVDTWVKATGFSKDTDERRERCDRITADVAIKAAEIWNAQLEGRNFNKTAYTVKQTKCGQCHIKGLTPEKTNPAYNDGKYIREVSTNMSCPSCHPGRNKNHPRSKYKKTKKPAS